MADNLLVKLIIYRNILEDDLIMNFNSLYENYTNFNSLNSKKEFMNEYYQICGSLVRSGYDSINDYISDKILDDENIFSLNCENGQAIDDKMKLAVTHDINIFKKLFELPYKGIAVCAGDNNNFINGNSKNEITDIIKRNRAEEIYNYLKKEYIINGCGKFRTSYAFSVDNIGSMNAVENFQPVAMENIYGYESQKNKIIENTKRFINGGFALNTLLVGDSGTGKSTTVKALIPKFKDKKLRLIEVEKENLYFIPKIVESIRHRGMYFIIFIDDLSFESNENSYKYLKSVMEGSIYEQPGNILFYVTSNRKHLIKETMSERENEVHLRDAINEQTSLSERFGLTILYNEPNQNEYFEIILGLAERYGVNYENKEEFLAKSKEYALQNGGRTGRTAIQFIKTYIK